MTSQASNEDRERSARVGAIVNDFVDRRAKGEAVSVDDLCSQYPDLTDDLREAIECLDEIGAIRNRRIELLLRLGILKPTADPRYRAELDRWMIVDALGEGGMGVVLHAYEPALDRQVAIKFLKPALADDVNCRRRFIREARAAAKLRHPNVITIHAVDISAGVPYIVMEYVEGPSLADVIRQNYQPSAINPQPGDGAAAPPSAGRSPVAADTRVGRNRSEPERKQAGQSEHEAQASDSREQETSSIDSGLFILTSATIREIFRQLMDALAAAHAEGLIHRDVKPSNILLELPTNPIAKQLTTASRRAKSCNERTTSLPNLESCIRVKLVDFGLARSLTSCSSVTFTNQVLGTLEYMSPEQARGDADIDHRTDFYSAGVVLFEMLTGRTPFQAETDSGVINKILNVPPPDLREFRRDVDAELADIVPQLMAKEREDRTKHDSRTIPRINHMTIRSQLLRNLHRHMKLRRLVFVGLFVGAGLLIAAMIFFQKISHGKMIYALDSEPITEIKRDPSNPLVILIRRGYNENNWQPINLGEWPPEVEQLMDPVLIHLPESEPLIAVGSQKPLKGDSLFIFDGEGGRIMKFNLTPDHYRDWPDCPQPSQWNCRRLLAADLDLIPGDELVAVTGDANFYPSGILLIDPKTWTIRNNFWHAGGLSEIGCVTDFIEEEGIKRPALIAFGANNKIDGDGEPPGPDYVGPRYTSYDVVSAAMILDPLKMGGLGPPGSASFQPAKGIMAYSFLDLPYDTLPYYAEGMSTYTIPDKSETARITGMSTSGEFSDHERSPCFAISIMRLDLPQISSPGQYIVKRDLSFHAFMSNSSEEPYLGDEYWRSRWRVLVQDGDSWRIESTVPE